MEFFGNLSVPTASVSSGGTQVVAAPPPEAQLGILPIDVICGTRGPRQALC